MLEQLRAKNPSLRLHTVGDPAFATFGRVVDGLEVSPLLAAAHAVSLPQEGTQYTASEPTFEALPIAKKIADELFGQMPTQIGFCFGHNRFLNAVEWHTSSEINVAVTPLVLILGHTYSIQNGTLSSDKLEAFFVPAGTVIEVFATTLHFSAPVRWRKRDLAAWWRCQRARIRRVTSPLSTSGCSAKTSGCWRMRTTRRSSPAARLPASPAKTICCTIDGERYEDAIFTRN